MLRGNTQETPIMPAPVSPEAKCKALAEKFPEWVWDATAMPKTSSEKFSLVCPEHGLFQVTYNHLTRLGRPNPCPKCSKRVGSGKIKVPHEVWCQRLEAVWGDRVRFVGVADGATQRVTARCREHGEFVSTPMRLTGGHGCPECARLARMKGYATTRGVTADMFVAKARAKHGEAYVYDEATYTGMANKVRVLCPAHGEFWQRAADHVGGKGCPACGRESAGRRQRAVVRVTAEVFLDRARQVHGVRYDYDLTTYTGTAGTVVAICPDHGRFEQGAQIHLGGSGCPVCGSEKARQSKTTPFSKFVERAMVAHGGKYTYEEEGYTNTAGRVRAVCPEHGAFQTFCHSHLAGSGCPVCAREACSAKRTGALRVTAEEFAHRATLAHAGKYAYCGDSYQGVSHKLKVTCPTHGPFWQVAASHLYNKKGCPKCANGGPSKGETALADLLGHLTTVVRNSRGIIAPQELDIYLPDHNLAVEYCGLYWHGEHYRSGTYHATKQTAAAAKGIKLMTVFEDEWLDPVKREILVSMIKHKLGMSSRVMARKLRVESVKWAEAKQFYDQHHIAGAGSPARLNYALLDSEGIVQCVSVGSGRYDRGAEELYRMCSRTGVSVAGGFSRLLKALRPALSGPLISYVDLRFGDGGAYMAAGFQLIGRTAPGYFWCNSAGERFTRHAMQKHKLADRLRAFDPALSEAENCRANGLWRIHDCGHLKLELAVDK